MVEKNNVDMETLKFNEQMIAAIKEGRKTQTRAIMNPQPEKGFLFSFASLERGYASFFGRDEFGDIEDQIIYFRYQSNQLTKITNVRVERLQDITEEDAFAEGIDSLDGIIDDDVINFSSRTRMVVDSAITWYATLWEKLYGQGSWNANPWVWVIEFKALPSNEEQSGGV